MSGPAISTRSKISAVWEVARYRPLLAGGIAFLGLVTAVLEGIGLGLLLPIITLAQSHGAAASADHVRLFVRTYDLLGIPFILETVILGVTVAMAVRYAAGALVRWLGETLRISYERDVKVRAFEGALDARVAYFDRQGSDEILNTIVTQATYMGEVIHQLVRLLQDLLLSGMYLAIAVYLAPRLTVLTAVLLGGIVYLLRLVIEPGYSVGDRVADANERIQEVVQTGTQGIRDVKLFGMTPDLSREFLTAMDTYTEATVSLERNQAIINNGYQFVSAVTVFALIYVALRFTSLSIGAIGVFLFAMFRLAPYVSRLNDEWYRVEGELPHLVRTQRFIDELESQSDPVGGTRPSPEPVTDLELTDVSFAYDEDPVLQDISFTVTNGEFVAFVGESGAGKSTIAALVSRLYEADEGTITANGVPIGTIDAAEWRSRLGVVRQDPYVFDDTLWFNVTLGRDCSREAVDRACEVAKVSAFFDALPEGYETVLGEGGVRLSGGQKQRVALARALVKEADVLVLDEATSELDSTIEREVQAAVESLDRDHIVIAIAHRFSTVKHADRIYTIEDGRVAEEGTHDELVRSDGTYASLYESQHVPSSTR